MIFTREQIIADVKKLIDEQKYELQKKIHIYDRDDMRDWVYSENDLVEEYIKSHDVKMDVVTYYDLRDLQIFMLEELEELREG